MTCNLHTCFTYFPTLYAIRSFTPRSPRHLLAAVQPRLPRLWHVAHCRHAAGKHACSLQSILCHACREYAADSSPCERCSALSCSPTLLLHRSTCPACPCPTRAPAPGCCATGCSACWTAPGGSTLVSARLLNGSGAHMPDLPDSCWCTVPCKCPSPNHALMPGRLCAGEKLTLVLSQLPEMQPLFSGLEPAQVRLARAGCEQPSTVNGPSASSQEVMPAHLSPHLPTLHPYIPCVALRAAGRWGRRARPADSGGAVPCDASACSRPVVAAPLAGAAARAGRGAACGWGQLRWWE